jgi:AcrR family transcriptional regulator
MKDNELSSETESRIIEAAKRVFIKKGRQGASMQDIADEAGINRTSLNYYFRSKDKLFDLIFEEVFLKFIPDVARLMVVEMPIQKKFEIFIDQYTSILQSSPMTPIFILHELTANPDRLVATIKSRGVNPEMFLSQMQEEIEKGNIRQIDPRQLIVNLLSLVIFPFAARPMLLGILFQGDPEDYSRFIEERKKSLKDYFLNSIKK